MRLSSLDVLRGLTVAFMILVNNPGDWQHIYASLTHAHWHGLTPTDLVFPFFLFAVGNAMAITLPPLAAKGNAVFWSKTLKRVALIFGLGVLLNWAPFVRYTEAGLSFIPWADPVDPLRGVRIMGVLQRIALCYLLAAGVYKAGGIKAVGFSIVGLAVLYYCVSVAGLGEASHDSFSKEGFFGKAVDVAVLGRAHLHQPAEGFDPEGLAGTLSATLNVLLGMVAGWFLVRAPIAMRAPAALRVVGLGAGLLALGYGLSTFWPINKQLWTGSFAFVTSGYACLVLAGLFWLIDVKSIRTPILPVLTAFGRNPLFIYLLAELSPKIIKLFRWQTGISAEGKPEYLHALKWYSRDVCAPLFADLSMGSLLYALTMVMLFGLVAWYMQRRGVYVRV